MTRPAFMPDRDYAPGYLVAPLIALAGPPPSRPGAPTPERWAALWREHADRVWREAYLAGMAAGLARNTGPIVIEMGESVVRQVRRRAGSDEPSTEG